MFGKIMSIPDALMRNYYTLLTDIPTSEIDVLVDPARTHPKQAKVNLGKLIVGLYHGQAFADPAAEEFDRVFARRNAPTDMEEICIASPTMGIIDLVVAAGFAKSNGEARRLITQNAVSLDEERIADPNAQVSLKAGQVLKVGKRRFGRVVLP